MTNIISKIENLADLIWQKPLYQYVFFACAAIVSISFMGYYFGTFDQASHIPFLKKTVDPSLYPGDHFFDLRNTHYSYFWFIFIPFYRLGILEMAMFAVYFAAVFLTFWALWRLSRTLFNSPLASFLTVIIFIFPHLSFGLFPVFEFSLLNRTFSLPFLLLALDFYFKRRLVWSFFILGLLYNLHVISVNFVLFMIFIDLVFHFKKIEWRSIITGLVIFAITALPVVIWKLSSPSSDLSIDREWFSVINQSMLYHLFSFTGINYINLLTLGVAGSIPLFFLSRHYVRSLKYDATITHFIYAVLLILLIEIITSSWFPLTIVIESQIIRASVFLIIFAYLYFIYCLVKIYKEGIFTRASFMILSLIACFSVLPSILFVSFAFIRLKESYAKLIGIAAILIFVGIGISTYKLNVWQPGINIFAQKSDNQDVQVWARENTAKDTIFITPPHSWWFYNQEWRVISERSTVLVLSEVLEAAFSPEYLDYWRPRFEDLAPGALAQFKGNYFENVQITKNSFYSLNKEDFLKLAQKYNVSYLVVEKPYRYDLPVVYENRGYVVYDLRTK